MESHKVSVGTRVKVGDGCNKPELRGMVGAVQRSWSNSHFQITAVLVRFEDGRYEIFWNDELEMAEKSIKA